MTPYLRLTFLALLSACTFASAAPLVFEGTDGPGKGKHIVFLAGDHEYRSEETLPALARILAKQQGFKCTVLFDIDKDGNISAGEPQNIPGMEALDSADLAVVFLRFQGLPAAQMKHFDDYLKRGGPVVGLRTATHAFRFGTDDPYAKYSYNSKGADYEKGFGHQVLGQTWVGHYGTNHKQSTRITVVPEKATHPILRGVKDVWVQAGAYVGKPTDGDILTMAQPLNGMTPDSPADATKPPQPSEWTRTYKAADGKAGRVFTSLYGTSEDITNEGYRRLLVNGIFWTAGLEAAIKPDLNIAFVGPFKPNTFGGGAYAHGIKPEMYAGWDSPIPANNDTGKRGDTKPKPNQADAKASAENTTPTAAPAPASPIAAQPEAPAKKKEKRKKAEPAEARALNLADVPADYRDPLPFAFQKDDVVAVIGNGLADRMQHDGWVETLLQSQLGGLQVRFRDMGVSGDRPNSFPRSKGVPSMTEYLRLVKADVVLAFFGYNESYDNKPAEYQKQLVDFVKRTRGSKANGRSFPRIVLFSPIAHEDTHSPNVPDGKAHNAQLEAYTIATEAAAKEAGVAFVDLFHPSLELFKAAKSPLTINGVHLSAEGNRQLGAVIARALLGKQVSASSSMEPLREAVLDKNFCWHNRYRATDANDIWGSRAGAGRSGKDPSNGDVLKQELVMLDVMTANRDQRIWAGASGKDMHVDDSNVPKPIPVEGSLSDSKPRKGQEGGRGGGKDGLSRYISGEEGIQHMAVPTGFKVNLFADEARFPQLANPVQMQVDAKGRIWAAVWPTYPKWEPGKPMNDAILIFHDDNHTGKATRVTEFAKVQNPLGFEFWNGGVLVTCMTEIIFLKDTDGDDKADVRIVMQQGLDTADTHHAANNLVYAPDGGIYWQSGIFMQHNFESPWGPSLNSTASGMYRFNPRTFTISYHAPNGPNSHGISFDSWGYHFATDGTSGRPFQVRPDGSGFKMFSLFDKEVRPVTSSKILSSANFPESMQGDFLICNVIGFLGIKQYHLERNPQTGEVKGAPDGAELAVKTTQADGSVTEDTSRGLLMSGDKNFRPSDIVFGEDGALYVSDWHNAIIGHLQHNIRDPNRDHTHGRIYRMISTERPLQKPVPIAGQPIPALLENLKHPVDGVRQRTRVELSARDTNGVIAETRKWMKQFDPTKKQDAHPLLEALWLFQQHNVHNMELLAQLMQSPEPHARIAANTVNHFWHKAEPNMRGGVIAEQEEAVAQKSGILSDTPELTTIRIATVREKMMYDVKELTVRAGKKVKLTFANPDFMPHNLMLVNPGKAEEIGTQAITMGAKGFENGFIPDNKNILWHTKLLDNGKEEVVEFTAPTAAGDYPYLCSFPGHHLIMRGVMHVK